MTEIERRVLDAVRAHLLSLEAVQHAIEAYRIESEKIAREAGKVRQQAEREAAELDRKIARIVRLSEQGADPKPLIERLNSLENERRAVMAQLRLRAP